MKILVAYFSQTGNTQKIAETICTEASQSNEAELIKIEDTSTDKFSVITLVDILEHLSDPEPFMSRLQELIQKEGILVIVTPDIDSLAVKLAGKKWWHYRIAHLNFFNHKSLKTLLANHGFEIIKSHRYAWHFSVFYLITRIFPGLKQKKSLQTFLKKVHLKLQLFDSWEIYARKN